MTYNEARDAYGQLSKAQRWRVLDLVAENCRVHAGPEAEAAFIKAVEQVQNEGSYFYGLGYCGG